MATPSCAQKAMRLNGAVFLNNSLVVRADCRPNRHNPAITLSIRNESSVNCYHFQSHTVANTSVSRKI